MLSDISPDLGRCPLIRFNFVWVFPLRRQQLCEAGQTVRYIRIANRITIFGSILPGVMEGIAESRWAKILDAFRSPISRRPLW